MTSTLKVFYVSVLFIDTCTLQIVCSGSALPVRNHNFVYRSHLLPDVPIIARQLRSLDLILAVCNAVFVARPRLYLARTPMRQLQDR